MEQQYLLWAVFLGALSAVSLPLGSALGLVWRPSNKIIGFLTAFGGGALIAALSVELVAPTAMHAVNAEGATAQAEAAHHLINMLLGAAGGGMLFLILDSIINSKGGFLRKTSSTISYFTNQKNTQRRQIIEQLSTSELIRHLPLDLVEEAVGNIKERNFHKGAKIFSEGDDGDLIYFVKNGSIVITRGDTQIATLVSGDVLGEISIITGEKRSATALAEEETCLLVMQKDDFDHWRKCSAKFDQVLKELVVRRLQELAERSGPKNNTKEWINSATLALPTVTSVPSVTELKEASEEHGGAPMAIWLGIFLDGIPESFVIGSALAVSIAALVAQHGHDGVLFASVIPYTLIVGLFLANFPEAMSSSIGMLKQGWSPLRVFAMWSSLLILTSVGAGFGYWLGGSVGHEVVVVIEGLAAGAMLTMIAAAMLPEAVHLGGSSVTGFGTLTGFLSAISFKLLE
ncbi:cyclic nucleotide-binding domain-containing protein [Alphaproteobacteria bacterium]|nr:cyclic nucleotide-binding domain-containing protein [Alphaproteobacteria bacterium]